MFTAENGSMGTAGMGSNKAQAGSGDQATDSGLGGTGGVSSGGEQMGSFSRAQVNGGSDRAHVGSVLGLMTGAAGHIDWWRGRGGCCSA